MSRAASRFRLGLASFLLVWTSAASAEEPRAVATRVHVDAPEGCASEETFWRATSRRTDRLRAATTEGAEAALEVIIRRGERGASGELRILRGGSRSSDRKVRGATCDEVIQALSLIAALAFDPAARADLPEDSSGPSPPGTTAPEGAPAPPPVVAAPPAASAATPAADRRAGPAPPSGPSARWRFGGGAQGGALGLASPGAVATYGAFVDLERDAPGLSPSFRAGAMLTAGAASSSGVDAELTWTLARASLCPVRLDLASGLAVRPCMGADVGSLGARAPRLEGSQARARAWVAPTATARMSWSPARVVFVELEGGVVVPVIRDEIAVDPSLTLYRAPSVVPSVQVGAGMRFP